MGVLRGDGLTKEISFPLLCLGRLCHRSRRVSSAMMCYLRIAISIVRAYVTEYSLIIVGGERSYLLLQDAFLYMCMAPWATSWAASSNLQTWEPTCCGTDMGCMGDF